MDSGGESWNSGIPVTEEQKDVRITTFVTFVDFAHTLDAQPLRITLCVRISPSEDQEYDGKTGKREEEAGQNRAPGGIQDHIPDKSDESVNYRRFASFRGFRTLFAVLRNYLGVLRGVCTIITLLF